MKRYIKSSTYDICDMVGEQFTSVRDALTALDFYEIEYGDTPDGNGYAVYRSRKNPDEEYTVEYEWVARPNRKNSYRAGIVLYIDGGDDYIGSSYAVKSSSVMASAWFAPNGKSYGKQTRRFPGKYLFTRKELKELVECGIAEDMAGTFDPMEMNYDIIGISWNETNGYRSGILIVDNDTGELYVGNSADANAAKL